MESLRRDGSHGTEDAAAPADVVVLGGGVSGCACAGVLAQAGFRVTLISSSLDVLGQPGYGPCLSAPPNDGIGLGAPATGAAHGAGGSVSRRRLLQWFSAFPRGLGDSWLTEALVPDVDPDALGLGSLCIIDRRAVSIRTKAWLESMANLQLRQGMVTRVEGLGRGNETVRIETSFGDELSARAAVIAVGLSLGGRHVVHEREFPGARMGEMPSVDLADCLEEAGIELRARETVVGSRVAGERRAWAEREVRDEEAWDVVSSVAAAVCSQAGVGCRPSPVRLAPMIIPGPGSGEEAGAPPSPYEPGVVPVGDAAILGTACAGGSDGLCWLARDGVATGEWYAASEKVTEEMTAMGFRVTRPRYTSRGRTMTGVGAGGAVAMEAKVYAVGGAAGFLDYADSLLSAIRAANEVAEQLGMEGRTETGNRRL